MSFLVDANVLCEATQLRPAAKVIAWLDRHDASLHVSTLTLAEISKGIHLLAQGRKRRSLDKWFEEMVESFAGRVVPFDEEAARTWGAFYAKHQQRGRQLPSFDSLIAATALAHGHTLATRNTADYPSDVPVVNPWE
ncbi:MAG: type II toxin-antitoxin system VapC family toxin [Chthoniobacteraceae bacterium]